MPKMALTHLEFSILFALLASIVMGIVGRNTDREQLRYAAYLFGCFIATLIGLGWLMYFGHG